MRASASGLFIREGSSDEPLAEIVEQLFAAQGVNLRLTSPDLARLPIERSATVESKLRVGLELSEGGVDLLVVHRDADAAGRQSRVAEIESAVDALGVATPCIPIIPERMTEAWLLLDESAIRRAAGNPRGRSDLGLPRPSEVERLSDPKSALREALLAAAELRGRRRRELERRFHAHRRRLLAELDIEGPVTGLGSFQALLRAIDVECHRLTR